MIGNQSGFVVGFILVAFIVYITLKGELPIYAGLLLLAPAQRGGTQVTIPQSQQAANQNNFITAAAGTALQSLVY